MHAVTQNPSLLLTAFSETHSALMLIWFHMELLPVVPEPTRSDTPAINVCRKVTQDTRGAIQSVLRRIFHMEPPETAGA